MTGRRPPKKSDPLVVRMPHDDKEAFLDACRKEGRTASDVVRDLIAGYVRGLAMRERLRETQTRRSLAMILKSPKTRIAAAASAVAGVLAMVALTAVPSAAEVDLRAAFEALDSDQDGRVTLEEFAGSRSPAVTAVVFIAGKEQGFTAHEPTDDEEYWFPISEMEDPYEMLSGEATVNEDVPPFDPVWDAGVYTMHTRQFHGFDRDGDGAVTFEEYQSRHVDMIAATFARFDADGDGRLTGDEFEPIPARIAPPGLPPIELPVFQREGFEATDRDGDGALSLAEFEAGPVSR